MGTVVAKHSRNLSVALLHSHRNGMLSPKDIVGFNRELVGIIAHQGRCKDTRPHSCRRCLRRRCSCLHSHHNRPTIASTLPSQSHHLRRCRHPPPHSPHSSHTTLVRFHHTDKTHPRCWLLHCSCMRFRPCIRTPSRIAGSHPRHQSRQISEFGWHHLPSGKTLIVEGS